ncbi:hypothetical protein CcaCcLH18_01501 [Colletotrichum camelliae]|nr:hypothetical protein CcaCcLH18_01501 [Colletotrichum camelliae]
MTSDIIDAIPKFNQCEPTKEVLDYVDLVNLDLSNYDNSSSRAQLAKDLFKGVVTHGILTISNHGISEERYNTHVDLAHALLTLPPPEKGPYENSPQDEAQGRYAGFKPSCGLSTREGFHKTVDHYNISAWDPENRSHPSILQSRMIQVSELVDLVRRRVLEKLLHLVALILEVPEETVLSTHALSNETTDYLRYIVYNPRPATDGKYRDLYLAGHTDLGSFTFTFAQPVSSLQVRVSPGEWKWVRYVPGTLVVNVGEAFELMTGGLFKAPVHRMVKPPEDQETAKRLGLIYFARPAGTQRLEPLDSPVLRRIGVDKPLDEKIYNMKEYLYVRRHGYKRLDFDRDRPRQEGYHIDPCTKDAQGPESASIAT